ncbi:hypothetical protein OSTOST_10623, partial [Ostertagia ostertagi]
MSNFCSNHVTVQELHKAKEFRVYGFTVIPIVLSLLAMILNVTYLIIQLKIYRKEEESARKRYLFLISRSLSTIMALVLLYVVIICWKLGEFAYPSAMIFLLLGGLNFLSITGTYIALTLLLYTAIVHPFFYQSSITMKHCYIFIASIWVCSTLASLCVGLWGATLFYPESAPVHCSYRGCQKPLAVIIVIGLSISYATVLGLYAMLLLRLHMRLRRSRVVAIGSFK